MQIEDTIFEVAVPVNTIPILDRLKEVMAEHKTNGLRNLKDDRIDKLLILLMIQYYGNLDGRLAKKWDIWDKEYEKAKEQQGVN